MTRPKDHGLRLVREVLAATKRAPASGPSFSGGTEVYAYIAPSMVDSQQEVFVVLLVDVKNKVIATEMISKGTLDASLVHPRDVFRRAIQQSSAAVILVHNHPSGDPEPSPEDIALTRRIADAGELLGIPVLDHVIIGAQGYVSLAERGVL